MLVIRTVALSLLFAAACVQTAPLGREIDPAIDPHVDPEVDPAVDPDVDPDIGSSSTTGIEDSGDTAVGSTGTDEPAASTGEDPELEEIPLPTDWSHPQGCPSNTEHDPYCLPAAVSCVGEGTQSWWRSDTINEERLWVAGIYQSRSDHGDGHHPQGTVSVHWSLAGSNTLVLSAYEPTQWTVTVSDGAAIDKIITTGHHAQVVNAPVGIDVEIHTHEQGAVSMACGFAVPGSGGGCEGEDLVRFAQNTTGLEVSGFDGCYQSTSFSFGW